MKHSERVPAGDAGEDMAEELLRERGFEVQRAERRDGPWDLLVNGHTVDVKAATYTAIKGSDGNPIRGFVFSNMHKDPTSKFYLLLCLSEDRRVVLGYYLLPAGEFRQRTLTLTQSMIKTLEPYRSNLKPLSQKADKVAARQPLYRESPGRVARRVHFDLLPKRPMYSHTEHAVIAGFGAVGAMSVLGGAGGLTRFVSGASKPTALRAAVAATVAGVGMGLGKTIVDSVRQGEEYPVNNNGPRWSYE